MVGPQVKQEWDPDPFVTRWLDWLWYGHNPLLTDFTTFSITIIITEAI